MANAKQLPSGSWRCLVYSHSVPVLDEEGLPIYDKKGKQKQKRIYESFTSDDTTKKGKREAERMALDFLLTKSENKRKSLLFQVGVERYISSREAVLSPATIREYRRMQRSTVKPLDNFDIYAMTQDDVQTFINALAKKLSPKSVRCVHGFIAAVIKHNRPEFALNTAMPKKVRTKLYIPSDGDIKSLVSYSRGTDMEIPVLLAAFGGMRRGEICAYSDDDIGKSTLHINKTMVKDKDKKWVVKSPKSYAGDRIIELPESVMVILKPVNLNPEQITKKFAHLLNAAKLPHFRFHDLRHYYASSCHALGVPDQYIMKNGGWGNDGVLKNVYRHTLDQEEKRVNDITTSHFEGLCNTICNTKIKKA